MPPSPAAQAPRPEASCGAHGRHISPQGAKGERETWQARFPCTHSRTPAITQQTFRASPRAPHARPPALSACRCLSGHDRAPARALPGQSPLSAAWLLPLSPSCLLLSFRNVPSPSLSPARLASPPRGRTGCSRRRGKPLQSVAGSPGDAVPGRGWRRPERSARGPFKQIQRLGLFC